MSIVTEHWNAYIHLTQNVFEGQPMDVDWAGVDLDGTLHFGQALKPRYGYEHWYGFFPIGKSTANNIYNPITQIYRDSLTFKIFLPWRQP